MKNCPACSLAKTLDQFNKRAGTKDGLHYICRQCGSERNRIWRINNPDGYKKWAEARKKELSDANRQYRAHNKDRLKASYHAWQKSNADRMAFRNASYKAGKQRATPKWADPVRMASVYAEAKALTTATGIKHEVDHVIPLKGVHVCGLHCESNLQILTRSENARKRNKFGVGVLKEAA